MPQSDGATACNNLSVVVVLGRGVHGNGNSHSHGIPMGFPWDSHHSHWNGSSFGLLMGMGIVLMGIAYFIGEK